MALDENNLTEKQRKLVQKKASSSKLVSEEQMRDIKQKVNEDEPNLAYDALSQLSAKHKLAAYIRKHFHTIVNNDKEVTDYIVKQLVGAGFLETYLTNPEVTDVGWNGTFLTVETNEGKVSYRADELDGATDDNILSIIHRFASNQDKELNDSNPELNMVSEGLRLSYTNKNLSPDGGTFSIRITKPDLKLNQNNFTNFAPMFILEFIHNMMITRANTVISGITGTGKTELQKLMLSFTDIDDRIIMIEDVQETHVKELFPDKDIYSWVTSPKNDIKDLVAQSLRNNPNWIIVSETRGSEAYQMLQAILTGNNIVTTLHAISAEAIPKRFANMIAMQYSNTTEDSLMEDILTYFDFGFHIQKVWLKDPVTGDQFQLRFLQEIVEYDPKSETGANVIFRQDFKDGQFFVTTAPLSESFKARMNLKFLSFDMPKKEHELRDDFEPRVQKILDHIHQKFVDEKNAGKLETKIYNGYAGLDEVDDESDVTFNEDHRSLTVDGVVGKDSDTPESNKRDRVRPTDKVDYSNPDGVSARGTGNKPFKSHLNMSGAENDLKKEEDKLISSKNGRVETDESDVKDKKKSGFKGLASRIIKK